MIQFEGKRRPSDPDSPSRFQPGDLVRHKRYDYRGVVVDLDLECRASKDWYRSNQTQPRREQPWYHVLVDGAAHTTYAAEENLVSDYTPMEIKHPLVEVFFSAFEGGAYVRNDRPWDPGE